MEKNTQPSSWSPCSVILRCPEWSYIVSMADCALCMLGLLRTGGCSFQVCSPRLPPFPWCDRRRGGSEVFSGAGAAPNTSRICVVRLGVIFWGRSLQHLMPWTQHGAKWRERFAIRVRNRNEENPSSRYRVNTLKFFFNDEFNGIWLSAG